MCWCVGVLGVLGVLTVKFEFSGAWKTRFSEREDVLAIASEISEWNGGTYYGGGVNYNTNLKFHEIFPDT